MLNFPVKRKSVNYVSHNVMKTISWELNNVDIWDHQSGYNVGVDTIEDWNAARICSLQVIWVLTFPTNELD